MKHILKKIAAQHTKSILLILLLILTATGIQGVFPYFTKVIVDKVLIGKEYSLIYTICGLILLAVIVGGISDFLKNVYVTKVAEQVLVEIKKKVLHTLRKKNYEFYLKRNSGELLSLFQSDLVHLEHMISWTLPSAFQTIIQIGISCAFLLYLNSTLFFICIAVVPVPFLIAKLFSKSIKTKTNEIQNKIAHISVQLNESLRGTKEIYLYSKFNWDMEKNNKVFRMIPFPKIEVAKLRAVSSNMYFVFHWCIYMLVFIIGTNLAAKNQITPGTIIAFSTYIISLFSPLSHLSLIYVDIQSAIGGLKRINEVFTEKEIVRSTRKHEGEDAGSDMLVRMENVSYTYASKESHTLKNINLEIPKGTIMAIEGDSGAGKSTMINVISGLIHPADGEVSHLTDASIVVVSQESFFFSMSIKENLTFGEEMDIDKIISICKMVCIHDAIQALPDGYETLMSEGGNLFSGGQKQRIALARALLQKPDLLILDEATSALDLRTENIVMGHIIEAVGLMSGSLLLISHNPKITGLADSVVRLKDGRITDVKYQKRKIHVEKGVLEVATR
ncbi:ABC transporter ATP-binding protein [Lysinibacillus sphaericus]